MVNYQSAINDMQAVVIERATKDPAFKAELMSNPRATIEKLFSVELPAEVQIEVKQTPTNTVILNLPWEIQLGADGELSDQDLESVSGGSKAGAKKFFTAIGSAMLSSGAGQAGAFKGNTAHHVKPC